MDLYAFLKRIVDIVGALIGIMVFAPVMIFTAIYIKIVSPGGPVFADMKKRVGKDNVPFTMYKFRSMIPNAQEWLKKQPALYQEYQKNGYKLDPDPRLIPGGKFIRKRSIDELPQFLNVLFGDMSLVGPRAYFSFELKEQEDRFPNTKELIKIALTTKPGITGVWQTSGRSAIGFEARIKMDADYATTRSILYDLLIILKTPFVVLSKKGAF